MVSDAHSVAGPRETILTSSGHCHNDVVFEALLQHLMLITAKADLQAPIATSIFASLGHFNLQQMAGGQMGGFGVMVGCAVVSL
jgi:hypothetical protein